MVAVDLAWDIHLSNSQVWQREATIVEISVQAPSQYARLRSESKLIVDGANVVALPLLVEKNEAKETYQISLRWRVTPYRSGLKQVKLPTIRYSLNGKNRVKWQAPEQIIKVQALPPYFPPTLPVGEVKIASIIQPKGILTPDTLAYWKITLQSKQVTPEQFPPVLKQIKASPDFEFFPSQLSARSSFEASDFQQEYLVPFKAKSNGLLELPTLSWHWFNPKTGRLQKQEYRPEYLLVLSDIWQLIIGLFIVIMGSFVTYKFSKKAYWAWQRWIARDKLKKAVCQPENIEEIKQAMTFCALTHDLPIVFSTQQWLKNWEEIYGENVQLRNALREFEKFQFKKK